MVAATYNMEVSQHDGEIQLYNPPIDTIESVKYWDGAAWAELESADYETFGIDKKYLRVSTVYQRLQIGYTVTANANHDIIRLMKELISVWYDHRPDSEQLEAKVISRLSNYKVWRAE